VVVLVPSIPGVSDGGVADGAALVVDHPPVVLAARVSPESVLVDTLWLIGSRLEPNNAAASKGVRDDADGRRCSNRRCSVLAASWRKPPRRRGLRTIATRF